MATNRVATPFAGMNVPQIVGDNFATWTPFANPTFVINDLTFLVQIPNYATVYDFAIDMPQLDSNGVPTLTIDVGDNLTTGQGGVGAAGWVAATTIGRSATAGQNTIRPLIVQAGWVLNSLPKAYSITNANFPTAGTYQGSVSTGAPAGIWLVMKIHAAAATASTTGNITGYVKYNFTPSLASQTNPAL